MGNCNILFRHLQKNHQYNHQFCMSFFSVFRSYYSKGTAVLYHISTELYTFIDVPL